MIHVFYCTHAHTRTHTRAHTQAPVQQLAQYSPYAPQAVPANGARYYAYGYGGYMAQPPSPMLAAQGGAAAPQAYAQVLKQYQHPAHPACVYAWLYIFICRER